MFLDWQTPGKATLPRLGYSCAPRRSAFTLVELMIAIALSLLLILGINAVFKLSGDAVGSGYQLSQMSRQFRLVGNTMNNDMSTMADYESAPAFIIQNVNTPAFRDKTDMASEPAFVTLSTDPSAMLAISEPPGAASTTLYPLSTTNYPAWQTAGVNSAAKLYVVRYEIPDDRNHRTDTFSFFAKDQYRRQTPSSLAISPTNTQFESDFTGGEAWIWYGHVIQPNNNNASPAGATLKPAESQNWVAPSASTGTPAFYSLGLSTNTANGTTTPANDPSNSGNPNNFFASQWILGRMAILMSDATNLGTYKNPYNNTITEAQNFLVDSFNGPPTADPTKATWLPPLGSQSATQDMNMVPAATFNTPIYTGLCDLAGATMGTFRSTVLGVEANGGTYAAADGWYLPLVAYPYTPAAPGATPTSPPNTADSAFRFLAKPWPNKTASDLAALQSSMPQEVARTMPVFGRGCSQFIVEYAGDYLVQQTDSTKGAVGALLDVGEDGQIDFDAIPNPADSTHPFKRIRWYGLTRSLDGGVSVENANTPLTAAMNPPGVGGVGYPEMVRPLWRYIQQLHSFVPASLPAKSPSFDHMPFEKVGDGGLPAPQMASPTGGAGFPLGSPPNTGGNAPAQYQVGYTCAWAPDDMHLDESTRPAPYATLVSATSKGAITGTPYFPSRSMLPWLIRITVRLDDTNGRIPQGQQMQFIFKVNRPH